MAKRPLPEAPSDQPTPSERVWHFVALLSIGSLFAVFGLQRLFGAGTGTVGDVALLALQTLPVLGFVPALLRGSARAAAALSFVSLVYFVAAVLMMVDPDARLAGSAVLFFSLSLFVSSAYYARQRGVRDHARAGG